MASTRNNSAFPDFYLPSTSQGLHWRIGFHKPKGAGAVICASEGVLEDTSTPGVRFFTTVLHENRYVRQPVEGRATLRSISTALTALLHALQDSGAITAADIKTGLELAYGSSFRPAA